MDEKFRTVQRGYTLVELLVVIVILGILATVTVFAVRGITGRSRESACDGDARILTTAADAYLAKESLVQLPAIGTGPDRHELYLVDRGMIREVSSHWNLEADGTLTTAGDTCS